MNHEISTAFSQLMHKFIQQWQTQYQSYPRSSEMFEIPSPCIEKQGSDQVFWLPKVREGKIDFSAVEKGIEISIHQDVQDFYGYQYSADLTLNWQDKPFELLQVWSDDDFIRLQENILGHLVTQRRLKLKPTIFIGTLDSQTDVISICNLTGNVIHERLGSSQRDTLAENIASFLSQCQVRLA